MKKTLIITVTAFFTLGCSGEIKENPTELVLEDVVSEPIEVIDEVVLNNEEEKSDSVFLEKEENDPVVQVEDKEEVEILTTEVSLPVIEEKETVFVPEIALHAQWNELLKKYVSTSGSVNYKGFKTDKLKLEAYIDELQKNAPQSSWSKNKKMAYWINVYNVFTVKLIVDNYPTTSITKLEGGKPWDKKFIAIAGKSYSLGDVENNILRKMGDARIHFAINCASVSCPILLNKAYTETNVQALLKQQTKGFLNNTSKNKISENSAQLSKIFEWYAADFESYGGVLGFIGKYKTVSTSAKITYLEYDWNLNE